MIRMTRKRYDDLKETETMVETIVESEGTRDRVDFALSHAFIAIGIVITVITRLF